MSLNVLTQGGGAGGEFASIFVTGLDENSTVTAAKDGKVLQGKWLSAEESGRLAGGHPECIKSDADYLLYTYGTRNYKKAYAGDAYACTVVVGGWLSSLLVSKTASAVDIYTDGDYSSGVMGYEFTVTFRGETWYVSGSGAAFQATAPTTSNVIHFGTFASRDGAALAFLEYATPKPVAGFEIAPIKEYGMYTVTATNGEETITQDVLVDAAMEYEIEMLFRLYLYREGDDCEDVTGGYSKAPIGNTTTNAAATKEDGRWYLDESMYYPNLISNNKINVTSYSKVYADIESTKSNKNHPWIGILTDRNIDGSYRVLTMSIGSHGNTAGANRQIVSADIAAVTGDYYIGAALTSSGSAGYVYSFWLE